MIPGLTVLVELVAYDTTVARTRDENTIVDTIQRPRAGSPDTTAVGTPVGDTAEKARITPQVFGAEHVGGGLAGLLCRYAGRQER